MKAQRSGGRLRPLRVIRPETGSIRPMASFKSVVLPEPFGPMTAVGLPGHSVSETPLRMSFPPEL